MSRQERSGPATNGTASNIHHARQNVAAHSLPALTPVGHDGAPFEPSAWLRERLALITERARANGLDPSRPGPMFVVPLGLKDPTPGTPEDYRCDRCGDVVPGDFLQLVLLRPTPRLFVTGGLCCDCLAHEGVTL